MQVFIAGATGATGRLLAQALLARGHSLKLVVRDKSRLPEAVRTSPKVSIHEAVLLDLDHDALQSDVAGCGAIVSCLGHNLSWRGVFGPPYQLVHEATRRLYSAAEHSPTRTKFILMSSTGVRNRRAHEQVSLAQSLVIGLLTVALPPHRDNERAAAYLQNKVGPQSASPEWVIVRPDGLTDEAEPTPYSLHPSPTRSAIFDAGKTSRINVATFMAELIEQEPLWEQWRGQMPVIYNQAY